MNLELVGKLFRQAVHTTKKPEAHEPKFMHELQVQNKFAELLVNECYSLLQQEAVIYDQRSGEFSPIIASVYSAAAEKLMAHFGLKCVDTN